MTIITRNHNGMFLISLGVVILTVFAGLLFLSHEAVRGKLAAQNLRLEIEKICAAVSAEPFHQSSAFQLFKAKIQELSAQHPGFEITQATLVIPATPDDYCEDEGCPPPFQATQTDGNIRFFSSLADYQARIPLAQQEDLSGAGSRVLCEIKAELNAGVVGFATRIFPFNYNFEARTVWARVLRGGTSGITFVVDPFLRDSGMDQRLSFEGYGENFRTDFDPFFNKVFDDPSPSPETKVKCSNPPVLIRNMIISTLVELASRHGQSLSTSQLLVSGETQPTILQDLRNRAILTTIAPGSCIGLYGGTSDSVLRRYFPPNLDNSEFEKSDLFWSDAKLWKPSSGNPIYLTPGEFSATIGTATTQSSLKATLEQSSDDSLLVIALHVPPLTSERNGINSQFKSRPKIVIYIPATLSDADESQVQIVRDTFGLDQPGSQFILVSPLQEKFLGHNDYPNLRQLANNDEAKLFELYWRYLLEQPYSNLIDEDVAELSRVIFTHGILRPEVQF